MPSGVTHLIAGTITGTMIAYKFQLPLPTVFVYTIGALFPDTDTRKSILGRWIPLWLLFKSHRRNLLHSLLGGCLFGSLFLFLSFSYASMFLLGYGSHLFLDMFNRTGIPLWYPFSKHMATIAAVKGGVGELLLIVGFYMMMVALLSVL